MGKHQWLPNGNLLITESVEGRAFEIDPDGALVWEYFNIVDRGRLALLTEAHRLPSIFTDAFFEEGRRTCGATPAAGVSMSLSTMTLNMGRLSYAEDCHRAEKISHSPCGVPSPHR
jgi:hypothetical protein